MTTRRRIIGFDRKIQLGWLDATADWAAQGLSVSDIRANLKRLLEGKVAGEGPHSARGKTMTVLLHTWVLVPGSLMPLREDGLALLRDRSARGRLALHWGMCVATYPFFRDVVSAAGRLLALQGSVALTHLTRRMTETWGNRSTLPRAVQRIVRSFVDWQVLQETANNGVFEPALTILVEKGDAVGPWLLEAGISNCENQAHPFHSLVKATTFFPFTLKLSPQDVGKSPRLELFRQGLDEDVVVLKGSS